MGEPKCIKVFKGNYSWHLNIETNLSLFLKMEAKTHC